MKKFMAFFAVTMMMSSAANAQALSKGAVQRLNLDSITLDGTTVTSTGAELNILDGVTATAAELNQAADLSEKTTDVTGATTLTTADCGNSIKFSSANGLAATLPAPTAGCDFWAYVAIAPTSGSHTFVTSDADETIVGRAFDMTGGAVSAGAGTAAADTISFVASTAVKGDKVELWSDGTNWYGIAFSSASGAITYTSAQ